MAWSRRASGDDIFPKRQSRIRLYEEGERRHRILRVLWRPCQLRRSARPATAILRCNRPRRFTKMGDQLRSGHRCYSLDRSPDCEGDHRTPVQLEQEETRPMKEWRKRQVGAVTVAIILANPVLAVSNGSPFQ